MTRIPKQASFPDGVEVLRDDLLEPETVPADGVDWIYLFPRARKIFAHQSDMLG